MAHLKLLQAEDDVRQKAVKAFREIGEAQEALKLAEARWWNCGARPKKAAANIPDAMAAGKARMLA